jgi:hypothetical protein
MTGLQAYLAGLTFALAASPCSTPVLATLLAYVSTTSDPLVGGGLLLAYTSGYAPHYDVMGWIVSKIFVGHQVGLHVDHHVTPWLKRCCSLHIPVSTPHAVTQFRVGLYGRMSLPVLTTHTHARMRVFSTCACLRARLTSYVRADIYRSHPPQPTS